MDMYRHGDLVVQRVAALPSGAIKAEKQNDGRSEGVVLAYGEVTGHAHRVRGGMVRPLVSVDLPDIGEVLLWDATTQEYVQVAYKGHENYVIDLDAYAEPASTLMTINDNEFLVVNRDAVLIHEEHGPIPLPVGVYAVIHQRVYSPEAIRNVVD